MRRLIGGPALGLALLLAAAALLAAPGVAHADTIESEEPNEKSDDPTGITFVLRVRAPAGLEAATLIYKVLNPDGNVGGSGEGAFTPGAETDVTFALETRTAERYIPVGSLFSYHWELEDKDGDTYATLEREFTFLDGRYSWQSQAEGLVTVFWYGNNDVMAMAALRAARNTLTEIGELLEAEVIYPVRLIVFRNEDDGELARRPRGRVFEELVNTGGQRVAPDLVLIFSPDTDVVKHEVGHIVTHVAGDGPFTSLPSWLDEGVAVYAQSSPGLGYTSGVEFAVATDNTLSLRSMQAPSNRPNEVNIFYGQSFSTVEFLLDEYGQEQFAELFRVHFDGSRIDNALTQVYGFDQNGLYNAWRELKGLRPLDLSAAPAATSAPATEATRAPIGIPQPGATTPTATQQPEHDTSAGAATGEEPSDEAVEAESGDSNAAAAIVIGLVTLVFAAALGAGAFVLLRRGGSGASSG